MVREHKREKNHSEAVRESLKAKRKSIINPIVRAKDFGEVTFLDKDINKNYIYMVIPCYNEKQNLPQLINNLSHVLSGISPFEIIVVDDGSSDGSDVLLKKLASKYPINLLRHDQNMGLSSTLIDGLLFAISISRADDLIITMDADNTHKSFYIRDMIETANEGADVVIASRYIDGGFQVGVSKDRILLSKFANILLNFLSGLKIKDLTSGFRCYRASVLKKVLRKYDSHFIDARGFEVQAELLIKLNFVSKRIREMPFKLRYDEKQGASKMPLFKTINNYIRLSLKTIVWRRQKNN